MKKTIRCEGWYRNGGAFTLGPVYWEQCANHATFRVRTVQDKKTNTLPCCPFCLEEARKTPDIKILSVKKL